MPNNDYYYYCYATLEHYQQIASGYDTHYEGLHTAVLPVILDKLNLVKDDVLLDLGSGTGTLAENIKKQVKLTHNVICVEPNESMVSIAMKKEGIIAVHATAEEFALKGIHTYHFNKVLLAFCLHHFIDSIEMIFEKLSESLPVGGVCLIVERQKKTSLPFFKTALEMHQKTHANDFTPEQWSSLASPKGFALTSNEITLEYTMTKSLWYKTLHERYTTFLRQLTDELIEEGISELEMDGFQELKEDDEIPMKDPIIVHQLVKQCQ